MALRERRLRPMMEGCYQYPTFGLFRSVHRHQLEEFDAFRPWDGKLQALVEREAHASGDLDDARKWESFYRNVAAPIRSAFWYGWEQVYQLEQLYDAEMKRYQNSLAPAPVLKVYTPPKSAGVPTALPEGEELKIWEKMAKALFDELNGDSDDQVWTTPPADNPFMRRLPESE
jgi:hypothetical protein